MISIPNGQFSVQQNTFKFKCPDMQFLQRSCCKYEIKITIFIKGRGRIKIEKGNI